MEEPQSDKRAKKEAKAHAKRLRYEDRDSKTPARPHKRSKSTHDAGSKHTKPPTDDTPEVGEHKEKRKKHKKDGSPEPAEAAGGSDREHKKSKEKSADKKRRSRHSAKTVDPDMMEVDIPADIKHDEPSHFPFFTQTISLYLPLFPAGFDKPLSSMAEYYLDRKVNHYDAQLGGVLLAYRNAVFSDKARPPRPGQTDHTPTLVETIDGFAVGFGWLSAEIDLFVPTRNAAMEGTVILQSEGHLGLNCWGKFNASIEAKRLPPGWTFVNTAESSQDSEPDALDEEMAQQDDALAVSQMHETGYWVDAAKSRVRGAIRFRIKTYEVGLQGDHSFISIEGTMLTEAEEKQMAERDREAERRRLDRAGGSRRDVRRVPEFSMTMFGQEDEEEEGAVPVPGGGDSVEKKETSL